MPELPEIESLRRSLAAPLVGRTLRGVTVHRPDLRETIPERELEHCVGQRITALERRAKYLLIRFDHGRTLAVHLGMSGQLTLVDEGVERSRHEHLALHFSEDRLRLVDARRFGLVLVLDSEELPKDRHFRHLGPEPLEEGFDGAALKQRAGRRRGPVKAFLMDAKAVVGVGNIYASEVLHRAGVHPRRGVHRIAEPRWNRLAIAVREILEEAIERGGTTLADFVDGYGRPGGQRPALAVYDRQGETCLRCGESVRRIVQSGRSTYYCPGCQR